MNPALFVNSFFGLTLDLWLAKQTSEKITFDFQILRLSQDILQQTQQRIENCTTGVFYRNDGKILLVGRSQSAAESEVASEPPDW